MSSGSEYEPRPLARSCSLLLERFPGVLELSSYSDELIDEPFYAYERFADDIHRRANEPGYLHSVGKFISELAESRDPLIPEVLVISILEVIAMDRKLVAQPSSYFDEKASRLLEEVKKGASVRTVGAVPHAPIFNSSSVKNSCTIGS